MSITSIEVKKNSNENNQSLLRRFSRRVQETGMIPKVKGNRYKERDMSKLNQKNAALKRIAKRKVNERLMKLGKLKPKTR
jgi:ribosomal protein S21